MTVVTLRPNATVNNKTVTGAASTHQALNDNSDASYVMDNNGGFFLTAFTAFDTFVLPINTVVSSVKGRVRMSQSASYAHYFESFVKATESDIFGGQYVTPTTRIVPGSSVQVYDLAAGDSMWYEWWVGGFGAGGQAAQQAVIDALCYWAIEEVPLIGPVWNVAVYELYIDVTYNYLPTTGVVGTNPTDAHLRTTRPDIKWVYTDVEGEPQQQYDVEVWKTADASDSNFPGAFKASSRTVGGTLEKYFTRSDAAVAITGAAKSAASGLEHWTTDRDLTNLVAYTAYVRVYQALGGTILPGPASSGYAFTLNIPLPAPPQAGSIVVTRQASQYRTKIDLSALGNLLTTNQAGIEADLTGWSAGANTTHGRTTAAGTFADGIAALSLTSVAAGDMSANTGSVAGNRQPVVTGKQYTALATFKAAASVRSTRVDITWYNAAGGLISTSAGTAGNDATGAFTQRVCTATAPALAVSAGVTVVVVATGAAAEVHYVDQISLAPGASTTWYRGGLVPNQYGIVERSADAGVTWSEVYNTRVPLTGTNNQEATVYDTSAPPNASYIYRMKTTSTDLSYVLTSGASPSTGSISTASTKWILRDPQDPDGALEVQVIGDLESSSEEVQGVFRPLGRDRPIVISDAVLGETYSVAVQLKGNAARDDFELLRKNRRSLILQSDTTEQWWVRFVGESSRRLLNNATRKTTPVYQFRSRVIEVDLPLGVVE